MGKITTKELFDRYYAANAGTPAERSMRLVDKPELYQYEIEIGKELVDMNVDELLELIYRMINTRNGEQVEYLLSPQAYDKAASAFRVLFNFYIETVDIIRNPLTDKRMRSKEAMRKLSEGKQVLRYDYVQNIIMRLHADLEPDRADHVELIILLYYCGIDKTEDILAIKENMIDHKNKTIMFPGRIVQLNDRCYNLLVKFHNMHEINGWRDYLAVSYRGSYYKFFVQKNKADDIDSRPESVMRDKVNAELTKNITQKYGGIVLNYRNLYWLGFFDFLVNKFGEQRATEIITSYRNSVDSSELMAAAREYGVRVEQVASVRKYLYPYVKL